MDDVIWNRTHHVEHWTLSLCTLWLYMSLQYCELIISPVLFHAAGEYMYKQLKINVSLIQKHVPWCQSLDELLLNSCESDHVMRLCTGELSPLAMGCYANRFNERCNDDVGESTLPLIRRPHKRCPHTLNLEYRFSSRGMRASSQLIVMRVGKAVLCFKDVCNCSKCVFVCEEGEHCSVHTQCEWVFAAEKSSGLQDLITLHRAILQIYHMGFLCLALESIQVVEH